VEMMTTARASTLHKRLRNVRDYILAQNGQRHQRIICFRCAKPADTLTSFPAPSLSEPRHTQKGKRSHWIVVHGTNYIRKSVPTRRIWLTFLSQARSHTELSPSTPRSVRRVDNMVLRSELPHGRRERLARRLFQSGIRYCPPFSSIGCNSPSAGPSC